MPICKQCNVEFPHRLIIDGVYKPSSRRQYCLACSPWGSFNKSGRGNPKKKPETKEAYRRRQNKRRRMKKLQAINYLGGRCAECQYELCQGALDFHHIDPSTKTMPLDAASLCRISWEQVKQELDKCVLLCCRCHREVEYGVKVLLNVNNTQLSFSF